MDILPFHNILIASTPQIPDPEEIKSKITAHLSSKGIHVQCDSLISKTIQARVEDENIDLLIALGGDGTMLRAGHLCAPRNIPILGINLGKFGFLTEIKVDQWKSAFSRLLNNDFWIERRMMIRAGHYHQDINVGEWIVLNEVVVSRGKIVRPVILDTSIDGRYLTTYVADGLIAATPTGSTAYALAVGGPILAPELRNILVVPVAPHLSNDRAIVLAEGSSVNITVHTDHQAVISVDGHHPIDLENGDSVIVEASDHTLKFIRIQDPGYFYRNLTPHMNNNPAIRNKQ